MAHGNEMSEWFFSHDGRDAVGLPSCPCNHKHSKYDDAVACARKRKMSHVCTVPGSEAKLDSELEEML